MRSQKGITLIALVITIIVLLILVAVSVAVVMQGGLFSKAKLAKLMSQYESEKEELLIYTVGTAYDVLNNELNLRMLANDSSFTSSWEAVNPNSFGAVTDNTSEITVKKKGSDSGIIYTIKRAKGEITDNSELIFAQFGTTVRNENESIIVNEANNSNQENTQNNTTESSEGNEIVEQNTTAFNPASSVEGIYGPPRSLSKLRLL